MSDPRPKQPVQQWSVAEILNGVMLGLFLMRFFLVAESAGQGETVWIVGLWLLVWFVAALLTGGLRRAAPGWLELSVGMLAGGHLLSAAVVLGTAGDKRSALNLAWEWLGVAVGWILLRQCCRNAAFRREMVAGLLAVGTSVAGLGLYQHYLEFPRLAARYAPMFDQLKKGGDPIEAAIIRKKLSEDHIPNDGPAMTLFEKRLRDSREPFGLFALANTFGGLLAVCLVIAVSSAVGTFQFNQTNRWRWLLVWLPPLVVLSWCLLLTKSRTAWIGTATGLAVWSLGMGYLKITKARLLQVGMASCVAILVGWGLTRLGGLDHQVLTEAPKSLLYRLQYWSATWLMIMHRPWLGVGPGQFRSFYLFYKLPEASEEISDPHNLFLDVAANGGVIAFAGLLLYCVVFISRLNRIKGPEENVEAGQINSGIAWGTIGMAIIGWCGLLVTSEDDRLLVLLPLSVTLYLTFRRVLFKNGCSQRTIQMGVISAGIALIVHLCGAGGIEMPAISLLLLSLVCLGENRPDALLSDQTTGSRVRGALQAVCSLGLLIGITMTAILPVRLVQQKIEAGDRLMSRGLLQAADNEYQAAAIADPLSEEPWRYRAELAFRMSEESRFQSNETFERVVQNLEQARSRDPFNPQNDRRLGECWQARWRVTGQKHDAAEAVAAYERAWQRYPTNALLMADLTNAYLSVGDTESAKRLAIQSLEQDRINHDRGHVDRYLPGQILEKLKELAGSQEAS